MVITKLLCHFMKNTNFLFLVRKRDFIRALIFAFNVKEFKWEIYYSRLKNYSLKMHNQADRNDFLIAIQELYNFKTTKKNRIQFDVQPNRSPKKLTYK